MTRGWLATGIVALIVLAFGAGFMVADFAGGAPAPTATRTPVTSTRPTATPKATPAPSSTAGAPDTSVVASAVVVPIKSAELAVGVSGVVSDVLVVPDQQVGANQPLLHLDQSTYLAALGLATADVDHAQAAVSSAQLALDRLGSNATQAEIDTAQAQLSLAQTEATQAIAQLAEAQAALKQTEVHAPFAGTVASVDTAEGEQATAGQPVVTVADLSSWLVETTDLSELEVVRIAVGDRATITFGALPGLTLNGTVTRIQLRGTSDQGGVLFAVLIKPDQYRPELRWNMSAMVHILPGS